MFDSVLNDRSRSIVVAGAGGVNGAHRAHLPLAQAVQRGSCRSSIGTRSKLECTQLSPDSAPFAATARLGVMAAGYLAVGERASHVAEQQIHCGA